MAPDEILDDLLGLDPALRLERYWGERSLFYNPRRAAPLGVIFASLKDHDGPNDASARLDREGVYRFAFGMARDSYEERFGPRPPRPAKGGVVALAGYDPTRLGVLMPHPVYAWMSWAQILAPTAAQYEALRAPLAESLELVRAKWGRRAHNRGDAAAR
jgi:hypothetical protein